MKQEVCPKCGNELILVKQGQNSCLNEDQFNSVKAGDYYCEKCPGNDRGKKNLCYWWNHELPDVIDFNI